MNTELLRTFLEVIERASYTKAAQALFISQPTAYSHVKTLERLVGRELVYQQGKRVLPNAAGTIVAQQARRVLVEVEHLGEGILKELDALQDGQLNLLVGTTFGVAAAPLAIARFRRKYPRVRLRVQIQNYPSDIDEALLWSHFDGAFHSGPVTKSDLVKQRVAADRLVAITPLSHPLAGSTEIEARQLEDVGIISYGRPYGLREVVEDWASAAHARIPTTLELDSQIAIVRAVEADAGVAIVSLLAAAPTVRAGRVSVIPLEPRLERWWSYVRPVHLQPSPAASAFIEEVRSAVADSEEDLCSDVSEPVRKLLKEDRLVSND